MIPLPNEGEDEFAEGSFPIVLCHNDAQENNIMTNLMDNQNVMVIDFEYAGWNPMCMDIAHYINETTIDNSYPGLNGIQLYPDNLMSEYEIELISKKYLEFYFERYAHQKVRDRYDGSLEKFLVTEYKHFKVQLFKCCLLNNFIWSIWSLALLNPDIYAKPGIFHYDFAVMRGPRNYKMIQ